MYDYISIHSDDYTKKVKSLTLEQYLISNLGFEKVSHLTFCKEFHGERIRVRGFPAKLDGSYAIYTLDGIEEVNLIEIDLPRYISDILEHAIAGFAIAIAKEFSCYCKASDCCLWQARSQHHAERLFGCKNLPHNFGKPASNRSSASSLSL